MTDLDTDDGIRDAIRTIATWGDPGTTWSHELGLARVHPRPAPRERRWKRPVSAAAAVVAVAAILAGTLNATSGPKVVAASKGTWAPMSSSPLAPRQDAIGLWTGTEVLILGGRDGDSTYLDGARYDPDADAWKPMAPLPGGSDARVAHLGAWTGREAVYVVGDLNAYGDFGYDALNYDLIAYEPLTNSWRTLLQARFDPDAPPGTDAALAPVPIEAPDTLVMVGRHLVMAGSQLSTNSYSWTTVDPTVDTWDEPHRLPVDDSSFDHARQKVTQVVDGRLFLAVHMWISGQGDAFGFIIDPTAGTATAIAPPTRSSDPQHFTRTMSAGLAGGDLVLVGDVNDSGRMQRETWRLDGAYDRWMPRKPPPDSALDDESPVALVSTDAGVVLLGGLGMEEGLISQGGLRTRGGVRLALDPTASRWAELPEPSINLHRTRAVTIWTGTEIVVWGGTSGSLNIPGGPLKDGARFRIEPG